jgi:nucleotide-binding universal stress UspA family protein
MKTIIAPTDFSATSRNAANYAADLANFLNANLVLLNVVEVPIAASEIPVSETVFEDMLGMAEQDLDNLGSKLTIRTNGQIEIITRVVMGTVATQIKEVADEYDPFAIVMGKKAGYSLERIMLGSSTLSSVKHNPYPILVVPENIPFKGIRKVGLACDLQDVAETIPFKLLNDWLTVFNPSLDIIHLSKHEEDLKSQDAAESVSLGNHLNKFKPVFHFLHGDKLAERLNEFAREQQLDLLIVVPKKHGFLALLDKKYSGDIITHNDTPILAVHVS